LKYIGVAEISRRREEIDWRGEVRGEREVVEIYRGSRNFGHMRERREETGEKRGEREVVEIYRGS
jgi:DNA-directed RNA polymerase subunit H (RpoH/RPB5)